MEPVCIADVHATEAASSHRRRRLTLASGTPASASGWESTRAMRRSNAPAAALLGGLAYYIFPRVPCSPPRRFLFCPRCHAASVPCRGPGAPRRPPAPPHPREGGNTPAIRADIRRNQLHISCRRLVIPVRQRRHAAIGAQRLTRQQPIGLCGICGDIAPQLIVIAPSPWGGPQGGASGAKPVLLGDCGHCHWWDCFSPLRRMPFRWWRSRLMASAPRCSVRWYR